MRYRMPGATKKMSPVVEASWTCLREIRRNLRSAKGIVMAVLFLLGGAVASLIYAALSDLAQGQWQHAARGQTLPPEAYQQLRAQFWSDVWGPDAAAYVASSPLVYVGLFKVSLWFIPFMTLLIGFDQVCGDLQYGSMRYLTIRARRSSIVAGKALAIWMVVGVLLLALHAFVWLATTVRGQATFAETLSWGPRMWGVSVVFTAAYAGLTVLVSALTRRPVLSLFLGLIAFSGIWVADLAVDLVVRSGSETFAFLKPLGYALPDHYETWLVTPRAPEMLGAVAVLVGFGAAATGLASLIVERKDV